MNELGVCRESEHNHQRKEFKSREGSVAKVKDCIAVWVGIAWQKIAARIEKLMYLTEMHLWQSQEGAIKGVGGMKTNLRGGMSVRVVLNTGNRG